MQTIKTDKNREAFLESLREFAIVQKACDAANISRPAVYAWRKSDPDFAAAWDEAKRDAADTLEDEAYRRARDGVIEESVDKDGNHIKRVKYSDTLLIFLLKGAKPEVYKERLSSEISGPGGAPIALDDKTAVGKLEAILAAAQRRKVEEEASDLA
jgi:hypothetical protein